MRQLTERLLPVSGKSLRMLAIVLGCICWLWGFASCSSPTLSAKIPTLPPEYYNCIETTPLDLINVYYGTLYYYFSLGLNTTGNNDLSNAEATYDNQYFVFKSLPVTDWMVTELDQGWIYIGSGIKCILVNPNDMKKFKLGDEIDVVGFNTGIISLSTPGLLFKDCYVLPAGAIQLPLSGGPGFTPAAISIF
jgi:hypothetical protein